MKSKNWLQRQKKDFYVKKAKKEGFLSRSAYKLIEIENKFKVIQNSDKILEIGSAPGGWTQVICNLSKKVSIHSFDILDMKFKHNQVKFFKENFLEFNFNNLKVKYDLILSDVAPNTTGHKQTDHLRMITLLEELFNIIENILHLEGNFIFKILKGSEEKNLISIIKKKFNHVTYYKPSSSRKESSEIFVVALGFIS